MHTELTLLCGPGRNLMTTITLPAGTSTALGRPTALLTNSGVISRAGPYRINVQLARRLADQGIPSIRFDLSGIGDSRRTASTLTQMEQWIVDTRAVMDMAAERLQSERFFMVGFCSGAEVAYRCALQDRRLAGILLWDLFAYPTLRSSLNTLWFKLQRAGALGLLRKLATRLMRLVGLKVGQQVTKQQLQDLEPARIPTRQEFATGLATLHEQGSNVLVAFCGGEPEWYNYPGQFHRSLAAFPAIRNIRCEQLSLSDHLLTRRESRTAFVELVDDWLKKAGLLDNLQLRRSESH